MMTKLRVNTALRFPCALLAITTVEAFVVLAILRRWTAGIIGGDGPGYHQIALNMLGHGAISLSASPPIEPTMYRVPGYPAFLAVIYSISHQNIQLVWVFQFFLLFLIAYWLYLLASFYVDSRTAKLSALLLVTYPPLVGLASLHLTEVFATAISVALILFVQKIRTEGSAYLANSALTGLASGLLMMVRPSLAPSLPIAVLGIWLVDGFRTRTRGWITVLSGTLMMALGLALVLTPWLIRNKIHSQRFILSTASGESLYFSMLQWSGEISYRFSVVEWQERYFPEMARRRTEVERQVNADANDMTQSAVPLSVRKEMHLDANLRDSAIEGFRRLSGWQIAKSLPRRLAYLWSTADFSTAWFRTRTFHPIVQGHFLAIVLFAGVGLLGRKGKLIDEWPLWVLPICVTGVNLIFHIEARYSIPARPFLLIYSGAGMIRLFELTKSRFGNVGQ